MVAVGEVAPEFEAPDQDGTLLKLSSLRGSPVVLYFYPKADTPGCTMESKGFQQQLGAYVAKGVRVVGVSTDPASDQKAFAARYGLKFPLLSDQPKQISQRYGVLGPRGTARRVTFLLDGEGRVLEVVDSSSPDLHLERAKARFL
ncbi:MAG TPA: peroxiredoxin [Thermoplasmata archaeon]|nr:peroxiredoxin [Thermoplasmata archaeon]